MGIVASIAKPTGSTSSTPSTSFLEVEVASFLATGSSSLEARRRSNSLPPEGYEPVVAWKTSCCCCPGGIYTEVAGSLFDWAVDAYQIYSFVAQGDYYFAAVTTATLAFCTQAVYYGVYHKQKTTILEAIQDSIATGVESDAWQGIKGIERSIEGPISGLIAPYGMALNSNLTMVQSINSVVSLAFSVHNLSDGLVQKMCGNYTEPVVAAASVIGSCQLYFVKAWVHIGAAAELSTFAVVSRTLHPAITSLWFLIGGAANIYAAQLKADQDGKSRPGLEAVPFAFLPVSAMCGASASPLSLQFSEGTLQGPAWPAMLAILARFAVWGLLCWVVDFPNGLTDFWTLGRPMGRSVFKDTFLEPGRAMCNCIGFFKESTCELDGLQQMEAGSTVFNGALLWLMMLTVPVHILCILVQLLLNCDYRHGKVDEDKIKRLRKKHEEILRWASKTPEASKDLGSSRIVSMADDDSA